MTYVVDASAVVAVLTDDGPLGRAVADVLVGAPLAAPALLPFEVANALRRLAIAGRIGQETAVLAHGDLLDLDVQLWPYAALGHQAFSLRGSLTAYDASYVALAAQLDLPLVTLDGRLGRAAADRCRVVVPGSQP